MKKCYFIFLITNFVCAPQEQHALPRLDANKLGSSHNILHSPSESLHFSPSDSSPLTPENEENNETAFQHSLPTKLPHINVAVSNSSVFIGKSGRAGSTDSNSSNSNFCGHNPQISGSEEALKSLLSHQFPEIGRTSSVKKFKDLHVVYHKAGKMQVQFADKVFIIAYVKSIENFDETFCRNLKQYIVDFISVCEDENLKKFFASSHLHQDNADFLINYIKGLSSAEAKVHIHKKANFNFIQHILIGKLRNHKDGLIKFEIFYAAELLGAIRSVSVDVDTLIKEGAILPFKFYQDVYNVRIGALNNKRRQSSPNIPEVNEAALKENLLNLADLVLYAYQIYNDRLAIYDRRSGRSMDEKHFFYLKLYDLNRIGSLSADDWDKFLMELDVMPPDILAAIIALNGSKKFEEKMDKKYEYEVLIYNPVHGLHLQYAQNGCNVR